MPVGCLFIFELHILGPPASPPAASMAQGQGREGGQGDDVYVVAVAGVGVGVGGSVELPQRAVPACVCGFWVTRDPLGVTCPQFLLSQPFLMTRD